jgi:8-oxo-dGTP pyrophosphatase MutT (NUDIX family)
LLRGATLVVPPRRKLCPLTVGSGHLAFGSAALWTVFPSRFGRLATAADSLAPRGPVLLSVIVLAAIIARVPRSNKKLARPAPMTEDRAMELTMGVKVVLERPDGWVLLERLSYAPGWHLPGGGVEAGETVYDAARREVQEECGLVVPDLTLLGVLYHPQEGRDDHVVVLRGPVGQEAPARADGVEALEVCWTGPNQLPQGTTPGTRRVLEAYWAGRELGTVW